MGPKPGQAAQQIKSCSAIERGRGALASCDRRHYRRRTPRHGMLPHSSSARSPCASIHPSRRSARIQFRCRSSWRCKRPAGQQDNSTCLEDDRVLAQAVPAVGADGPERRHVCAPPAAPDRAAGTLLLRAAAAARPLARCCKTGLRSVHRGSSPKQSKTLKQKKKKTGKNHKRRRGVRCRNLQKECARPRQARPRATRRDCPPPQPQTWTFRREIRKKKKKKAKLITCILALAAGLQVHLRVGASAHHTLAYLNAFFISFLPFATTVVFPFFFFFLSFFLS